MTGKRTVFLLVNFFYDCLHPAFLGFHFGTENVEKPHNIRKNRALCNMTNGFQQVNIQRCGKPCGKCLKPLF